MHLDGFGDCRSDLLNRVRGRLSCGPALVWRVNGENFEMNIFTKLLRDQSGASAAEYALILAIVGAGIALASYNLGTNIKGSLDKSGTCMSTASASAPPTC